MRLTIPGYILLILLILVLIYFIFIARVFLLTLSIDGKNRNSNSQENITVSIPKEARIGDQIEVIVYYYPNLFNLFKKEELRQIIFYDSTNAHSYKNSLNLAEISQDKRGNSRSLGLLPYYESFSYKIPQQVCPVSIVYESCDLVSTKTGKGTIKLIHEPIVSKSINGEGYQGDGEKIEVPINVIK